MWLCASSEDAGLQRYFIDFVEHSVAAAYASGPVGTANRQVGAFRLANARVMPYLQQASHKVLHVEGSAGRAEVRSAVRGCHHEESEWQ